MLINVCYFPCWTRTNQTITIMVPPKTTAKYWIFFFLSKTPEGAEMNRDHNAQLTNQETVTRFSKVIHHHLHRTFSTAALGHMFSKNRSWSTSEAAEWKGNVTDRTGIPQDRNKTFGGTTQENQLVVHCPLLARNSCTSPINVSVSRSAVPAAGGSYLIFEGVNISCKKGCHDFFMEVGYHYSKGV